jgi:Uma2 family endonuclease
MALPKILSLDEFLVWLEKQEEKYEFFGGRIHQHIVAMAGGTDGHNTIEVNVVTALRNRLRGSGCRPYGSNQLVKNVERGEAFFPDATIICGPMTSERHGTLGAATNPAAVLEVLSPSTERYDRYRKLDSYQSMPSVREVILVLTDKHRVERYIRKTDGWRFEATIGLGSVTKVFDLDIPMSEIYEDVELPSESEE